MTFVKDNKMWLIKDVSVILKVRGILLERIYHRNRSDISVSLKICFDGIMVLMEIIIPSKLFSKENRILVFMRLNRGKQMI